MRHIRAGLQVGEEPVARCIHLALRVFQNFLAVFLKFEQHALGFFQPPVGPEL